MPAHASLSEFRQLLHRFPELSGSEYETASRIKDFIAKYAPPTRLVEFDNAGFAAVFDFKNDGPQVLFRCELDALPITEKNNFDHRSTHPGISHKCGHDGHMTILCGLATSLTQSPLTAGTVVLLFQPAEENGEGAQQILSDPAFQLLQPDYVFALHNIPGRALHEIIIKESICAPSVISFAIQLIGQVAHASAPETGSNPAMAIAELIHHFNALNVRDTSSEQFAVLTPVFAEMGQKAYGIAAGAGSLHYTIRTWTMEQMDLLQLQIKNVTEQTCSNHGLRFEINWFDHFPAVQNDHVCNEVIRNSAEQLGLHYSTDQIPFKFGEDFGWFTQKFKCALFGLGAGMDCPPLHNEYYDFPDELIETGITLFYKIAEDVMDGGG